MWRLAVRNLWRHGRRSLLTAGGMALALGLMMVSMSLNDGAWGEMITQAIRGSAGHAVVQAPGWQEERDAALTLGDATEISASLQHAYPEAVVLRRTFVGGLLTSPMGSMAVELRGIEPAREAEVVLLDERIVEGAWPEGDRDLLIGRQLADVLQVEPGDRVVFMAQVGAGDVESRMYRICGIYRAGSEVLDAFTAFGHIDGTRSLWGDKDVAHQVAVILPMVARGADPAERARVRLADRDDLEVLSWEQALPVLQEQLAIDQKSDFLIYGFMGLIAAVGVLNTVLMSVLERVREFGVLLALGMRPRQLAGMVVLEGAALGMLGGGLGIAVALPFIVYLQAYGIDYGDMLAEVGPVGGVAMDPILRAQLDGRQMVMVAGFAVVLSTLASLWPARHATRLEIVDALRHS